jgi:hypothetical protein
MLAFAFYSWLQIGIGILAGCWLGAAVGLGVAVILASRRISELEEANSMLLAKLRVREKSRPLGLGESGPILMMRPNVNRPASAPLGRAANGR